MFKPYRLVEGSEKFVVYEFKTIFVYLLYAILLIILVGYLTNQSVAEFTGIGLMVFYLCFVSTQYMGLSKKIKQASLESTVESSGSKWSFTKPLRIQIPRDFA